MEGVVLLHGLARTARSMARMARALDAAGFETLNLDYESRRKPLVQLAEDVHRPIAAFSGGCAGPIHFVTHSMGGLLVRAYLARHRPKHLGRVVMLGPPNNGSEIADVLQPLAIYRVLFGPAGQQLTTRNGGALLSEFGSVDYELGIIAGSRSINALSSALILPGPNDGTVTVRSTKLYGMTDHIIVPATHTFIMRNRNAVEQTIAFLRAGRFLMQVQSSTKNTCTLS